jgi:hypothetical protein
MIYGLQNPPLKFHCTRKLVFNLRKFIRTNMIFSFDANFGNEVPKILWLNFSHVIYFAFRRGQLSKLTVDKFFDTYVGS